MLLSRGRFVVDLLLLFVVDGEDGPRLPADGVVIVVSGGGSVAVVGIGMVGSHVGGGPTDAAVWRALPLLLQLQLLFHAGR